MNPIEKKRAKALIQRKKMAFKKKQKRPLFVKEVFETIPESKRIAKNIHLIKFLCYEANPAQIEEILYEIDPHQLTALRELIGNAVKKEKTFAENFLEEEKSRRGVRLSDKIASRNIERSKEFVTRLLSEKATRPNLKKNARLVRAVTEKGLKLYERRMGITSSSSGEKRRSQEEDTEQQEDKEEKAVKRRRLNKKKSKREGESSNEDEEEYQHLSKSQREEWEETNEETDGEEEEEEEDSSDSDSGYESYEEEEDDEENGYQTDNARGSF